MFLTENQLFSSYAGSDLQAISLWGTIKKTNKSELWNRLSYRGLPYFFKVGSQTFRNYCKILRSQPQNSTSMTSKMARANILKIASNQCKSYKYWWEVWILGRGCKKTKRPQQWGVCIFLVTYDRNVLMSQNKIFEVIIGIRTKDDAVLCNT